MTVEEMYTLEIEGITNTINEYATNHFIISYTKQLKTLALPNDKEKIILIISRLIEWYIDNIKAINESNFIINKEEHQLSYKLLQELKHRLLNH